ncbi:MAG TPA: CBS domain-containing protein, partial [Polyangiaceae bacterium]
MKLREILHGEPPTASPDESAAGAWDRMRALEVDHLVVLKGGELVGVLSRHDLTGPAGGTHRRMGRRVADLMRPDVVKASPATDVRRAA